MEMEKRNITNKMSAVNDIAAPNLSCLATTMDTTMEKQHFILEHTKLNDDDYDQDQVLVPMEITNKVSAVNEIAAQTLSCLAATSIIEHDQEAENVVEKSCSQLVSMDTGQRGCGAMCDDRGDCGRSAPNRTMARSVRNNNHNHNNHNNHMAL